MRPAHIAAHSREISRRETSSKSRGGNTKKNWRAFNGTTTSRTSGGSTLVLPEVSACGRIKLSHASTSTGHDNGLNPSGTIAIAQLRRQTPGVARSQRLWMRQKSRVERQKLQWVRSYSSRMHSVLPDISRPVVEKAQSYTQNHFDVMCVDQILGTCTSCTYPDA